MSATATDDPCTITGYDPPGPCITETPSPVCEYECTTETETPPPIANTGFDASPFDGGQLLILAAMLIAAGWFAVVYARRRRQENAEGAAVRDWIMDPDSSEDPINE